MSITQANLQRAWAVNAHGYLTRAIILCDKMQGKCRGPKLMRALCASLRSQNWHWHLKRAIYSRTYSKKSGDQTAYPDLQYRIEYPSITPTLTLAAGTPQSKHTIWETHTKKTWVRQIWGCIIFLAFEIAPKPTAALLFECRCILQNLDCSATATRSWKWPAVCIAGYVTHSQESSCSQLQVK